jgi:siroheme synthase-like protein
MAAPTLHPLFLTLAGRRVVVVGAGPVGARKAAELHAARAVVCVVAPAATEEARGLTAKGAVEWVARPFEETDLDGAWLAVAATGDPEVQRRVAAAAEARRIFCVAVDDPKNASAYGAAVVRRAPLTIAISSSGEAPALVRLVRELFEELLPDAGWVDVARALRAKWRAEKTPMRDRFRELVRAYGARAAAERG